MKLKLFKIGQQTEHLSACRLSLALGILNKENHINSFLQVACDLLSIEKGILTFKHEPYGWYRLHQQSQAFLTQEHRHFEALYLDQGYIDQSHPNYQIASDYIQQSGIQHQRFLALNLKKDGEILGHIILFDDHVTAFEQKTIQTVLVLVNHLMELIALRLENIELEEKYEEQLALNSSKDQFLKVIAHDLRAPFHGLIGFSEVLLNERKALNEESIEDISKYLHETTCSTFNLLENLLNWSMAEAGEFAYYPIQCNLNSIVESVVKSLSCVALKKQIEIVQNIPANIMVYADIHMVTSILHNLLSNALKFTPTNGVGKVEIRAEQDGNFSYFMVQDNGVGMPTAKLEHIFLPKINPSKLGTFGEKGSGLGLVLCKKFTALNHGAITVSSKQGQGTCFKVMLPQNKNISLGKIA